MSGVQDKSTAPQNLPQFIEALEGYAPTVPEQLSTFYLQCNGLAVKDDNIPKLVSLAADKILTDILHAAQQRALLKKQRTKSRDKVDCLELDDLEGSLAENRIFLRRKKMRGDDITQDPSTRKK